MQYEMLRAAAEETEDKRLCQDYLCLVPHSHICTLAYTNAILREQKPTSAFPHPLSLLK